MVEAKSEIALPAPCSIVPEGVELFFVRMEGSERIGPALVKNAPPELPRLRLHHGVMLGCPHRENITIFRDNVPVATQRDGPLQRQQVLGMDAKALHPSDLVVKFLGSDRVAIGEIERSDNYALHFRFDVAAVRIVGVARQANTSELGRITFCKDGDSVEAFLAVPHGAIAGTLDVGDRQRLVSALELLKTDNIRLLSLEPFDKPRKPRADSVEVIGCKLHTSPLSGQASPGKACVSSLRYPVDAATIFIIGSITRLHHADCLPLFRRRWQENQGQ